MHARPSPTPRSRRRPKAARARRWATVISVASMLSLGGVLAWRDAPGTASPTSTVAERTTTANSASANATSPTSSSQSPSSSAVGAHTTTSGS